MQVKCEHPTILTHPHARWFSKTCSTAVVRGVCVRRFLNDIEFNYTDFSPKKLNIQLDEVDSCYLLNEVTGETKPLYMVVPCGKCRICRDYKQREYIGRAIAEGNQYDEKALFLTLTYAPAYLPEDGLCKRDVQLFLKRLRFNLDVEGYSNNIRYIACGEYGSHTKRAHYHIILYNFPCSDFPGITSIQHFIEKAWSRYKLQFSEKDGKLHRVAMRDADDNILRYPSGAIRWEREQLGFVMTKPVTSGCVGYVTKYMRKDCTPPDGKNPTFFLASNRGGGIGSAFIRSLKDEFESRPDMVSYPIVDKNSGNPTVYKMPIGAYCKSILVPSASRFLKQKQYKTAKRFFCNLYLFRMLSNRFRQKDILDLDRYDFFAKVKKHYYDPMLDLTKYKNICKAIGLWSSVLRCPLYHHALPLTFLKNKVQCEEYYLQILEELENDACELIALNDERDYLCHRDELLSERNKRLRDKYGDNIEYNIPALVDSLKAADARALVRETF